MSQLRRIKRRKKAERSEANRARKQGPVGGWFSDVFVEYWFLLPVWAVSTIVLVMGIPLFLLVELCSSRAARLRRDQEGPDGEGETNLVAACGLITLGGVTAFAGHYFASPWLFYGGLILVGFVLIRVGVRSIVRWSGAGSAVEVGGSPDAD